MRQYKIDNGQLGGVISVFSNSLVILAPFSFIGILALNYDRYIRHWISLELFILLSVAAFILYEWIFFAFIFPSMMRFGGNQTYIYGPIKDELDEIKNKLQLINGKIDKYESK